MSETRIEIVTHDWSRFDELLDLCFDVLYSEFGVKRDAEWYHPAHGSEFVVALGGDDELLGTARLLPAAGYIDRQVRQVAVRPSACGQGVGRELMFALERLAIAEGAEELWLNSRASAYGFYERLGFVAEGDEFVSELTGILHRGMRKRIG